MPKPLIPGRKPAPTSDGPKATASVSGRATERVNTDGNRLRQAQDINEVMEMPFVIGDGRANVAVTRGFKNWFSTREAGLTVESTVTISVACNQDMHSILEATHQAAIMAEERAKQGAEEMGAYLKDFGR